MKLILFLLFDNTYVRRTHWTFLVCGRFISHKRLSSQRFLKWLKTGRGKGVTGGGPAGSCPRPGRTRRGSADGRCDRRALQRPPALPAPLQKNRKRWAGNRTRPPGRALAPRTPVRHRRPLVRWTRLEASEKTEPPPALHAPGSRNCPHRIWPPQSLFNQRWGGVALEKVRGGRPPDTAVPFFWFRSSSGRGRKSRDRRPGGSAAPRDKKPRPPGLAAGVPVRAVPTERGHPFREKKPRSGGCSSNPAQKGLRPRLPQAGRQIMRRCVTSVREISRSYTLSSFPPFFRPAPRVPGVLPGDPQQDLIGECPKAPHPWVNPFCRSNNCVPSSAALGGWGGSGGPAPGTPSGSFTQPGRAWARPCCARARDRARGSAATSSASLGWVRGPRTTPTPRA